MTLIAPPTCIGLSASSVRSITLGISSPAMKGKLNFWFIYVYGLPNLIHSSLINYIQSSLLSAAGAENLECS